MDRLDQIEFKLQSKLTEVCQAQTEDIDNRHTRSLAEEAFSTREYTQDVVSTVHGNLLLTSQQLVAMVEKILAAQTVLPVPATTHT